MDFLKEKLTLPSGAVLRVMIESAGDYPGISIWMENGSQDCGAEPLCLAEYNPDHPAGQELCIGAYQDKDDEPVFYESYHKGENE
jgi:hypothetical protein